MLARLERSGAAEVLLPAATVRALPAQPAAPMTDLPALRRIRYHGEPLADVEADAVRRAFDVELVHVPSGVTDVDGVRSAAAGAAERELAGIDLDAAVVAVYRFGYAALLSMLNAFVHRGLFTGQGDAHTPAEIAAATEVAPAHRGLLGRWLDVLTGQGLLHGDGGALRAVPEPGEYSDDALRRAWTEAERGWLATAGAARTVEYARRNAERLPDLLSGRCGAVPLLFPEGRTGLAAALYRENLTGRYQHAAVAGLTAALAARWQRPLRVLEVGAGTGATTERVVPALAGVGVTVDYLYTDVSASFLDEAREWLSRYPWVRFGRYDIDAGPGEQGYQPASFDVVLGGGVLNAARDTDASVRWLTELLCPGGWLVLTEPTAEEFWILTSQAFLMAEADDDRAATGATFLTLPQWNRVLDAAGLHRVVGLPPDDHPLAELGHRVFAAVRPEQPSKGA
ncbi:hypothetical protein GCM10027521_37760 [Amycolatopsis cihanbeyliensis]